MKPTTPSAIRGVSRADLAAKFAQFDFSACPEEWDYPPHSFEDAALRAERVRQRLKHLSGCHKNIIFITHRGFIAFLVNGEGFDVCGIDQSPSYFTSIYYVVSRSFYIWKRFVANRPFIVESRSCKFAVWEEVEVER